MRYVLLTLFTLLLSFGQTLFKQAALAAGGQALASGIINRWTVAGLVVYGLATVLWISILRTTPLSVAYPFTAIGFLIVPLAAHYLFGEPLHARYLAGAICIIVGILLTAA